MRILYTVRAIFVDWWYFPICQTNSNLYENDRGANLIYMARASSLCVVFLPYSANAYGSAVSEISQTGRDANKRRYEIITVYTPTTTISGKTGQKSLMALCSFSSCT
jgi:hypothetical protein